MKTLGQFMQDLGRRYVRYVNSQYQRTGTLWEGRYRAGYYPRRTVCAARLRLPGWYERNTGRAQHLGNHAKRLLREHAQYWQLGNTRFKRATRNFSNKGITQNPQTLEHAVQTGWMLGMMHYWHGRRANWTTRAGLRRGEAEEAECSRLSNLG